MKQILLKELSTCVHDEFLRVVQLSTDTIKLESVERNDDYIVGCYKSHLSRDDVKSLVDVLNAWLDDTHTS